MIRYRKGPTPSADPDDRAPDGAKVLLEASSTPGMDWDGFHERQPVREALVRDQRGLCAYCQRRIEADDAMHIEHWVARSASTKADEFRWANLLGVCRGVTADWTRDDRRPVRHCDTSRGDTPLFLNPVEGEGPSPRDHLVYSRTSGAISPRGGDPRVAKDIETLNLAATVLERGRAQALDGFRKLAEQHAYAPAYLRKQLEEYERRTTAPEYFEVIRAYILHKLRQTGAAY